MKTIWSIAGKAPRELAEWRKLKELELEEKTGVSWSNWDAHGKIIFSPCLDKVISNSTDADILFDAVGRSYKSFLMLSEESGMSLPDVMAASLHLIKVGLAIPTVDRMGKVIAIKRMR